MHLAALAPAATVVALVRDPVARAHAAWDQNRRAGHEGAKFIARRSCGLGGQVGGGCPPPTPSSSQGGLARARG